MTSQSLEAAIQEAGNVFGALTDGRPFPWPGQPEEYTNWIDEQRAWRETCALRNHTPVNPVCRFEGPDALEFLSEFAVNDFGNFDVGQAKQYVACNPDGYMIGDMILFHLDEETFGLTGVPEVANWLRYNVERTDYDVSADFDNSYELTANTEERDFFRYSIQGPNAVVTMEEAVDDSVPDIPFFRFDDVTIDGKPVRLFHHGMAGETGFEFWGPYEHAEDVWDTVVEAGSEHGLRRLGNRSYQVMGRESGWIPGVLPAIFGDEMEGYREWVNADDFTTVWALSGSFDSDDITDYYLDPVEVGYGHLIDFDHDFVGKEALRERSEDNQRTKVTLVWNQDDLVDVWRGSLHQEGETFKYMDYPVPSWSLPVYNEVSRDGETVGVAKKTGYSYNEREVLSLAVINTDLSDPGTEVTLHWGESGESSNPAVEPHVQTELRATVAPAPYVRDRHDRDT